MKNLLRILIVTVLMVVGLTMALLSACGIDRYQVCYPSPSLGRDLALVQDVVSEGGATGASTVSYFIEELVKDPSGPTRSRTAVGALARGSGQPPFWSDAYTLNACDLAYDRGAIRSVVLRSGRTVAITTHCASPGPSIAEQQKAFEEKEQRAAAR